MRTPSAASLASSRRTPLAVSFASMFALFAPPAWAANTWFVDTCDEGVSNTEATTGSLRWALDPANAQNGDTISLSLLTPDNCSAGKISLSTGDLVSRRPTSRSRVPAHPP